MYQERDILRGRAAAGALFGLNLPALMNGRADVSTNPAVMGVSAHTPSCVSDTRGSVGILAASSQQVFTGADHDPAGSRDEWAS
jgi:hypothetical protein